MKTRAHTAYRSELSYLFTILCLQAMWVFLLASSSKAQSAIDGTTPLGLAPGSPDGSYELSGFDNVNLFNGRVDVRLSLFKVSGRGGIQLNQILPLEYFTWVVREEFIPDAGGTFYYPETTYFQGGPGYGLGSITRRQGGSSPCIMPGVTYFSSTLTRLTFTGPDGTQYELRDQETNGRPHNSASCPPESFSRGNVFVTSDGTSATFISDSPIYDDGSCPDCYHPVSGYLLLANGTRYRVENDAIKWVRDRNGNTFTVQSGTNSFTLIDSLNRSITYEFYVNDVAPYGLCDRITYKGFGGATRIIRVSRGTLSDLLRPADRVGSSGYTLKTYYELFPELNGSDSFTYFNITNLVSKVWLPDGRTYSFKYNSYGEIARIDLPTGGSIEYDWDGGPNGAQSGATTTGIYRRVFARRVYGDGRAPQNIQTFTSSEIAATPGTLGETCVTREHRDGSGNLISSEKHYFYTSAAQSFSMSGTDYPAWKGGKEYKTEDYDSDGNLLRRTEYTWEQRAPVSWWGGGIFQTQDNAPPNDPRITSSTTTLFDVNPNLVMKKTFSHDQYNNQTEVYEYDFGAGAPGPLIRRTRTDYVTFNNGVDYAGDYSIHIRNLPLQEQVFDAGGTKRAETIYEYDNYNQINPDAFHAALGDCPNISGHDGAFWTGYLTRGNSTKTTRSLLDNSGGVTGSISGFAQYDVAGNVIKVIDANGNATQYGFRDNFGSPVDPTVQSMDNPANNAPGELGGQISYAFPFKVANALGHKVYTKYDYYLGRPALSEDANGVKSNIYFNDALDRPTRGVRAIGTSAATQSVFVYNDSDSPVNGYPAHSITTVTDKDVFGESNIGNGLKSVAFYDDLGRTRRVAAYEGATWTIKDTQFDALGRVSQVSNPYRAADPGSASPPAGLWTTTDYDALGRVIRVTTPDSAHVDTAYSGNQVTVTDQAGKKRRSKTDAIGRLVKVTEDPGGRSYDTFYLYDALGNLRKVTQGTQSRWFSYDSLSRLIRVANPEQSCNPNLPPHTDPLTGGSCWAMAYSYYPNGNLFSKTDARDITATYGYDVLNRNTTVTYSDSTPGITRTYDTATLGKGRLQKTETAGSMGSRVTINDYDAMGRPLSQSQQFFYLGAWGTSYTTQQTYDLAGNIKTLKYPSNHTVNYSHDQAGRLSSFSGNLGGSAATYADTIGYNAAGQMIKERFETNTSLYHNLHYNSRLQPVDSRLGDSATDEWNWSRGAISFLYGTTAVANGDVFANDTDNNGNLRRQLNYVPIAGGGNVIPQQDDYYYDALNRISAVREQQRNQNGQWSESASQAYSYDLWGNRTLNLSGEVVWADDALPAGAVPGAGGGDGWNWISSGPSPLSGAVSHISNIAADSWSPPQYSGNVSHQSAKASGEHQHYFFSSPAKFLVASGGKLYAYIYIDPENVPEEVMLQWGEPIYGWEHRAYWGSNMIGWGADGTESRRYMGPLPAAGGWVRLEVPASAVGLGGLNVDAMAFTLYGGRANWDLAGVEGWYVIGTQQQCHQECDRFSCHEVCITVPVQEYQNHVIMDDSFPAGAGSGGDGGDSWNWTGEIPNQMVHQHYFDGATNTLSVNGEDVLYTWVYLDPANMPKEVMLQWNDGTWEHRAYWGENKIGWGVDGTASRKYMGGLPAGGSWVKLEVPAYAVDLEGKTVDGMAFTLYGGRAAWDKAGKVGPLNLPMLGPPINNSVYTVDAATNRLTSVNGAAMSYDSTGNQTNDGSGQRTYDAENRMLTATNGGVSSSYVYGADGRRVRRIISGQETWQVHGISGELVAEYQLVSGTPTLKKEYGYRNGQLLVVWDGSETGDRQLQWLVQDHLGSTRMMVDRSGSLGGVKRRDFGPFGEEMYDGIRRNGSGQGQYGYEPPQSNIRQKFGSYERDNETGLDYSQFRYYSSTQGRFTSPDPVGHAAADENDPQSWNLYSYTRNSPLILTDPEGLEYELCARDGNKQCSNHHDDNVDEWRKKEGIKFINGKIFDKDGNYLGTYRRLSDDRWSAFQNGLFYGNAKDPGLPGRMQGVKTIIYTFTAINLTPAVAIMTMEVASGAAFEGVNNYLLTVRSARPFSHLTLDQLKALIRGKNTLLSEWFQSGGRSIPNGLNSADLKVYLEIALRDIAKGNGGVEVVGQGGRIVQVQFQRLIQILRALGELK